MYQSPLHPQPLLLLEPNLAGLATVSASPKDPLLSTLKLKLIPHKIIRIFRGSLMIFWFLFCVLPFVLVQFIFHPVLNCISLDLLGKFTEILESLFGYFIAGTLNLFTPYKFIISGKRADFDSINISGSIDWFKEAKFYGGIIISNHQIYADWLYLWALGYYQSFAQYIKFVAKHELRKIPVFGRALSLLDTIFLKRQWELDQRSLESSLNKFNISENKKFLIVFPEGTTVNPKFMKKSDKYAKINNLEKTKYVLHPRTSGTFFCVQSLKDKMPYLYDLTIAYSGLESEETPEYSYPLTQMFTRMNYPKEIHIHIQRYCTKTEVPSDEKEFSEWLTARYYHKDAMLEHFHKYKRFPQKVFKYPINEYNNHPRYTTEVQTQIPIQFDSINQDKSNNMLEETIFPTTKLFIPKIFCIISVPYFILYLVYLLVISLARQVLALLF